MKELTLNQIDRCWPPPERVVLVTSTDPAGKPNIISVGWKMRASVTPPVFAIGLGKTSHSGQNILASQEFVLAVPGGDLAEAVMYCGTRSGRDVDKFRDTGLTPAPAKAVKASLIAECLANLECRVIAVQEIGDHRVFFGEVVACWTSEREGKPLLVVGETGGYDLLYQEGRFRLGTVKG